MSQALEKSQARKPRVKQKPRKSSSKPHVREQKNKNPRRSKNGEDQDDAQARILIAQIQRGNQQAFAELVERYHRQVAALAYKMVNNYDEAADVAQIVFVKMYDNVWRYDDSKKFYSWLYRITVNAAIDYMRKHKRHRHESLEDYHETTDTSSTDPESSYRRNQISQFVEEATQSLSAKQRSAFVLRDIEGCDINEVADSLNVSEATVRWYLHRARTKIRKELKRQCPQVLSFLGIY
ncbi:MAG: RNA polymerase sigma factor [Candidatus Zixiibacteriota bacterium]|nr:MAG: RNA polymerase sigma factor [candidate division Zixibacteria bacterium]